MALTKKHFIALADAIKATHPRRLIVREGSVGSMPTGYGAMVEQWQSMMGTLADFCASQNPNFNRERWLGYIAGSNGPSGGKVGK